MAFSAKLSGNTVDVQARNRRIARRWLHSCAPGEQFERQNAAAGGPSALIAWRLSAFGTVAGFSAPVVMHKVHILTDY
jgi:hypothetical protein